MYSVRSEKQGSGRLVKYWPAGRSYSCPPLLVSVRSMAGKTVPLRKHVSMLVRSPHLCLEAMEDFPHPVGVAGDGGGGDGEGSPVYRHVDAGCCQHVAFVKEDDVPSDGLAGGGCPSLLLFRFDGARYLIDERTLAGG